MLLKAQERHLLFSKQSPLQTNILRTEERESNEFSNIFKFVNCVFWKPRKSLYKTCWQLILISLMTTKHVNTFMVARLTVVWTIV